VSVARRNRYFCHEMPVAPISVALLTEVVILTGQAVEPRAADRLLVIAAVAEVPIVYVRALASALLHGKPLALPLAHPRGLSRSQCPSLLPHRLEFLLRFNSKGVRLSPAQFEVDEVAQEPDEVVILWQNSGTVAGGAGRRVARPAAGTLEGAEETGLKKVRGRSGATGAVSFF
jgi:hypothetical protein